MMLSVEKYAEQFNRLHPQIVDILQPYFPTLDLSTVRVRVYPRVTSLLKTNIWVLLDTIIVLKGTFNTEEFGLQGFSVNSTINLVKPWMMATIGHELKHCQQWREASWSFRLYWLIKSLWVWSTPERGAWHKRMEFEREAIMFQDTLRPLLEARRDDLLIFNTLR